MATATPFRVEVVYTWGAVDRLEFASIADALAVARIFARQPNVRTVTQYVYVCGAPAPYQTVSTEVL